MKTNQLIAALLVIEEAARVGFSKSDIANVAAAIREVRKAAAGTEGAR